MQFLTHPMGVYHSIKPSELVTGISQTQRLETTNNIVSAFTFLIYWTLSLLLFVVFEALKVLEEKLVCVSQVISLNVKKACFSCLIILHHMKLNSC